MLSEKPQSLPMSSLSLRGTAPSEKSGDASPIVRPSTLVIAEAGVNHNGSSDMAHRLIEAAKSAGADAVKFQIFQADKVLSRHAFKADYQKRTTDENESFLEMGRKLELSYSTFESLHAHCEKLGIAFLASPFDQESLQFLADRLRVRCVKIASGEITHGPLLLRAARLQVPLILSTGMSRLDEIQAALALLAFGYTTKQGAPSKETLAEAWRSEAGQRRLSEQVTLLHCTTEYPAPFPEVNLKAMDSIRAHFGLPVGLSDHTLGIAIALAAVARGATVIEKHFTLDKRLPGPDHLASLEPDELKAMVDGIRAVEASLGSAEKTPGPSETKNQPIARRSLVAAKPIAKGELFSPDNLESKRPGTGISPMRYWEFIGRPADRDYSTDDIIQVSSGE